VYHGSYEVPKYNSYSSDDQSYHHDLHHRADDGEDVGVVAPSLGGVELEDAAQLCQHLEGATRALCYLCGEEDSACWDDPCWLAREEEQEECRLQLDSELLNLEKKNLEKKNLEREDEGGLVDDGSNEDLGATAGPQSFVTGSEEKQEVAKDVGTIKDFERMTELGWLHTGLEAVSEQDAQAGGEPGASLLGSFNAREEGFQDQGIDPSLLELLTLNSVPITDPV